MIDRIICNEYNKNNKSIGTKVKPYNPKEKENNENYIKDEIYEPKNNKRIKKDEEKEKVITTQ